MALGHFAMSSASAVRKSSMLRSVRVCVGVGGVGWEGWARGGHPLIVAHPGRHACRPTHTHPTWCTLAAKHASKSAGGNVHVHAQATAPSACARPLACSPDAAEGLPPADGHAAVLHADHLRAWGRVLFWWWCVCGGGGVEGTLMQELLGPWGSSAIFKG